MKRTHVLSISSVASFFVAGCVIAFAQPPQEGAGFWRVMDTHNVGAKQFIQKHPKWDGRGAVIAVLDTGVDMGVPGLLKTSTGKTKVIEARDFTGQGDVTMLETSEEVVDGTHYLKSEEGKVRGYRSLGINPSKDDRLLGFLREDRFKNSAVKDINKNGNTKDEFAVLAVKTKAQWVAYVDLDGDGDLSQAKPIQSYHVAQQTLTFILRDPKRQYSPLTFALNIEDDGSQVSFHYDDGGHGTHVAGIAAGYKMMGRNGFNGIAPGAQVMSLKIGDNTLSGGSTTSDSMRRAIEYAGEWTMEHKRSVIINISYGIGSELEGHSDIDLVLDDMLAKYPLLAASVSAGNEGPGLSTVGTPAASKLAVTAAAMLPKASSEAMFGTQMSQDKVFGFSSRGGELAKPDLLAPGIASATTAPFDARDIKGGTSMAAPQLAGVHALLVSAAKATKTRFSGGTLKRALINSATPISNYTAISQGAGVPNVAKAFKALRKLATHKEPFSVAGYAVNTSIPTSDNGSGEAAYWRTGTWLPASHNGHSFTIEPIFPEGKTTKSQAGFQTMLRFKSVTPWLKIDRGSARLTGERALSVNVSYRTTSLNKPGVYTGLIHAYPDDGAGLRAFSLWNTVVVPYTFGTDKGYTLDIEPRRLEPGDLHRYPILVPPGATHLNIAMETPRGKYGKTILEIYDPRGRPYSVAGYLASSERGRKAHAAISGTDLMPGIWEVIAYSSFRTKAQSNYRLSVKFRGIEAQAITQYSQTPGQAPSGSFTVTNRFDTRFSGPVGGQVVGYGRTRTVTVDGDTFEEKIRMNSEVASIQMVFRLDSKTYNRFTDIPINVLDANGKAIVRDGFVNGIARITIPNKGASTLQIKGGFTTSGGDPWKIKIEETYVRKKSIAVNVGPTTLYPNVPASLHFTMKATPPQAPKGFANVGSVTFKDNRTKETWLTLPVKLD